jgi:hypothetical protein
LRYYKKASEKAFKRNNLWIEIYRPQTGLTDLNLSSGLTDPNLSRLTDLNLSSRLTDPNLSRFIKKSARAQNQSLWIPRSWRY